MSVGLLKQICLFLNVLCVTVNSLIKFCMTIFYILFRGWGTQNTPLVAALAM